MAVGTLRTLREHGLAVPGDVSVVGFDGIALGDFVTPSLTTVDQPRYDAGQTAFRLLLDRIEDGYAGPSRDIALDTCLVVRESSAPPSRTRRAR
jgi:DNA-binding LacI/PurR family transcriptional regulator